MSHPALTEQMVEAAAKALADSPTIDAPKLPYMAWMGTAQIEAGWQFDLTVSSAYHRAWNDAIAFKEKT